MTLCGCCGNKARIALDWCQACLPHIVHGDLCFGLHYGPTVNEDGTIPEPCTRLHKWMQTFYAQTDSPCPYSTEWSNA